MIKGYKVPHKAVRLRVGASVARQVLVTIVGLQEGAKVTIKSLMCGRVYKLVHGQ